MEEGNLGNFHKLQEGGGGALLLLKEHGSKPDSQPGPSHDQSRQTNTADHHNSLDTDQEHIQQGTPRRHEAVLAVGVKEPMHSPARCQKEGPRAVDRPSWSVLSEGKVLSARLKS